MERIRCTIRSHPVSAQTPSRPVGEELLCRAGGGSRHQPTSSPIVGNQKESTFYGKIEKSG